MDVKTSLHAFGLTDKEITVYLELLPLGSVTLQEIAKRLDYPRSTTYHTLSYLVEKGLVAKIIKNSVTWYTASNPEKLISKLEEKQQMVLEALPYLQQLKKEMKEPSQIEIYEGFKGVQTILSDLVEKNQMLYYFGGYVNSLKHMKHLPNHVRINRMKKKIPAKLIIDPCDPPMHHLKEYREISEVRFHECFKEFPCMIFIYGDKVSMFSHKTDLVGVIIKNQDFANAMKMIFEMYWDTATPSTIPIDKKLSEVLPEV